MRRTLTGYGIAVVTVFAVLSRVLCWVRSRDARDVHRGVALRISEGRCWLIPVLRFTTAPLAGSPASRLEEGHEGAGCLEEPTAVSPRQ